MCVVVPANALCARERVMAASASIARARASAPSAGAPAIKPEYGRGRDDTVLRNVSSPGFASSIKDRRDSLAVPRTAFMLPLRSSTIPIETGASSSLNERMGCRTPSSVSVKAPLDSPFTKAPRRSTTVTGTRTRVAPARNAGFSEARRLHRRCCFLPGAAFHKETPQRLTASDQAVMAVGKRKHRQEGNRLAARTADPAANRDPVMPFVVSLFPSTTVPDNRISHANRTPAIYSFRRFGPIGFQLALHRGK
jgi:hypothetical protein